MSVEAAKGVPAEAAGGPAAEPASELRWSVWPARAKPLAALVLIAGSLVLGVLTFRGTGDRLLGLATPVFLLLSLSSFLLPTAYRLTDESIEVRSLGVVRIRPWGEMKRFEADEGGIFLSPFERRSWLDAYRGVRLLVGGNRDQVAAFVEARLKPARKRG